MFRQMIGKACTPALVLCPAFLATAFFASAAIAQGSLGIGTGEAALPATGMFSGLLSWITSMQQDFYRAMTGALKQMREDPSRLWLLVGLSFAYGIFHAAGPGHGKAVISSYMLANEIALRRGVVLSFVSALLQGATAIVLIGLVFLFLRGTSVSMGDATHFLEVASYAVITIFGAWLLWKKGWRAISAGRAASSLSAASLAGAHTHHGHAHKHDEGFCAHLHAPDPRLVGGKRLDWKSAWTAIAAVGVRPCSGALIVLTFAFLNSLWLGGIVSVLAMSLGTGIMVAALATLAVSAKNVALRLSRGGRSGERIHNGIEIFGALMIMAIGLLLFTASISN